MKKCKELRDKVTHCDRDSCYQQEERTDNLPANAPVKTRTKTKHLLYVLTELVQSCNKHAAATADKSSSRPSSSSTCL